MFDCNSLTALCFYPPYVFLWQARENKNEKAGVSQKRQMDRIKGRRDEFTVNNTHSIIK